MIPVPEPVLSELAVAFGTQAEFLHHFGGGMPEGDGTIYAFPHGHLGRLLKIMAIPAADVRRGRLCLEERLRFVRFLGEHDARIVYPHPSPQGNLYEALDFDDHLWVAYTMDIAPGGQPAPSAWDEGFFRAWGQAIGQLHRLAQQYPSWRSAIDPESGAPFLTWEEEWASFRDWCQDDDVRKAWIALKARLDDLPVTRDCFGFIHNDPHIWNLRADGDNLTLLDFDVANHHWFLTDVGVVLQSVLLFLTGGFHEPVRDPARLTAFLACFVEGYERENRLSAEWWDRLDLFIAYRRILLYIVTDGGAQSWPGQRESWKRMILSEPDVAGPSWYEHLRV